MELTFVAGQTIPVAVPGNYIRCLSSEARALIYFGAEALPFIEGIGLQIPQGFNMVRIYSETAQTIEIATHQGRIDDNRFVASAPVDIDGVVEITADYSRATGGESFSVAGLQPPVSAEYATFELINPSTSSKNLVVNGYNGTHNHSTTATLFLTPDTEAGSVLSSGGTAQNIVNMRSDGGASVAQAYRGTVASAPTSSIAGAGNYETIMTERAIHTRVDAPPVPIIVPPGFLLRAYCNVVDVYTTFGFKYFEVVA